MRVSRERKDQSHERIVAGAARLLRERGLEGASVGEVMQEAGLTHGGFYKHFGSKEALAAEALGAAFDQMVSHLQPRLESGEADAAVADFRAFYLSQGHVDQPGIGCPVAALGGEVGRGSEPLKRAFGAGVNRMAAALARGIKGSARARREGAMRELALLVGALVIARASDPETARDVLAACSGGPRVA